MGINATMCSSQFILYGRVVSVSTRGGLYKKLYKIRQRVFLPREVHYFLALGSDRDKGMLGHLNNRSGVIKIVVIIIIIIKVPRVVSVVVHPSLALLTVDSLTGIVINLGDRPAQQPKPIPSTKFALSLIVLKSC